MRLEQQYRELLRLKEEIDICLKRGTDFQNMKELMLLLAKDQGYQALRGNDNQIVRLECFLKIWLDEERKLPDLGIKEDIFWRISSLDELEQKYQRILYCGLRIENNVPELYINQSIEWLAEQKVSGIAIGEIVVIETRDKEQNLLSIARKLKQHGNMINAVLLLQYAREKYPEQEELLLEEADCWLQGQQWERAYALLTGIKEPSAEIQDLIMELQEVVENG